MQSIASLALINIGCLAVLIAFIFKDEMKMRLLLMIGAAIFLIGFSLGNNFEYWYAGVWAGLILLLNGVLLRRLLSAKSTAKFSQKEKILYQVFKGLQADEFRDLLKITTWNTPTDHTTLTTEDRVSDSLFYVLQGKTEVSKGDKIFTLSPNTFIGEVGYFLRSAASATTVIEEGSVYVSWRTPDLRELEVNSPGVRSKLYELMNKDMASKVASSQG
jgi:CRP-like cAMP-binding protein